MIIGIDVRLWNETGVGRYIRNLVLNLAKVDHDNKYVLFAKDTDHEKIRSSIDEGRWSIVSANVPWHGISEQMEFPKLLNKSNIDLIHFPYFSVPFFYYKPFVVTVHDLIINKFNTGKASTLPYPVYLAKRVGYNFVLSNAVYRSAKVIVPSDQVKKDLLKEFRNLDSSKVVVTREGGFEENIKHKKSNIKGIEGKYLLRVGNFYPHKNVEGLLEAFSSFVSAPENKLTKLVLVGKRDYFYKRVEEKIKKLSLDSNVKFYESPDDDELYALYKNAAATIIPSFMEGFSLTAVEAMSQGSPVIVSDIPVHREICEDSAIYCNPNDVNDIKQKINFAFSLVATSRKELIEQGKRQSKKFSWEKMAKETLEIYNSV